MNKVILAGRLTKDPDVRETTNGMKVARYTIAVDRYKEGADFINCIAFDKRAEFAEKYLSKGRKIMIEGHIQTGSYEKDGHKVFTTDVVIDSHEFCESKGTNDTPKAEKPTQSGTDGFMDIPDGVADEGLPFN